MYQSFLIKYAEIAIKGKNRHLFEDALVSQSCHELREVCLLYTSSCFFKYLLHCLCLVSIDFTAQIMQCCSSHTFSFIFPLLWLTFLIKKITLKQTSIVTMGGLLI